MRSLDPSPTHNGSQQGQLPSHLPKDLCLPTCRFRGVFKGWDGEERVREMVGPSRHPKSINDGKSVING